MLAVLVLVRDFFVAVILGWLGVTAEPADMADNESVANPQAKTITVSSLF